MPALVKAPLTHNEREAPQMHERCHTPTTLEGLKSRAKRMKRETGCKHISALDAVAREMGFAHYSAAQIHFTQIGGVE